jgi:alkaline phosphatase D
MYHKTSRNWAWLATWAVAAAALFSTPALQAQENRISHGPMLGNPGARQMAVWARTEKPGTFQVRYGTEPGQLNQVSAPVTTRLENDNTGSILLQKLKPDTRYYYEAATADKGKGVAGSFRTLPDSKDFVDAKINPRGLFNFRFEFACGNNQGEHSLGTELPAFKTMVDKIKDKVHFAILNGDWLYEDSREFSLDQWQKQVGITKKDVPDSVKLIPTITGVWQNYKSYLERGKPLAIWHRHVPSYFTLDDHEILNDVAGCGQVGFKERRTVFRDIAIKAWNDYLSWSNPTEFTQKAHFGTATFEAGKDILVDPNADFTKLNLKQMANLHVHWGTPDAGVNDVELDKKPGDPNAGVYDIVKVLDKNRLQITPAPPKDGQAAYSIGTRTYFRTRVSNCDFFFLDTRTHRQKHDFKNPGKPGVTMLGKQQKDWLLKGVAASDADFIFVISSVNFVIPHVGAGGMAFAADDKDDAWTVFLHERKLVVDAFEKAGKPVFVLTGDLHNSFAVKITDNVWEFASGPHNSRNHPAGSEGDRPATGKFDSRGHVCDILWSTYFRDDTPTTLRHQPVYCVVQVNNVFNNPILKGEDRWVAFPQPQVVFQYHDGFTGDLMFAHSIRAKGKTEPHPQK